NYSHNKQHNRATLASMVPSPLPTPLANGTILVNGQLFFTPPIDPSNQYLSFTNQQLHYDGGRALSQAEFTAWVRCYFECVISQELRAFEELFGHGALSFIASVAQVASNEVFSVTIQRAQPVQFPVRSEQTTHSSSHAGVRNTKSS